MSDIEQVPLSPKKTKGFFRRYFSLIMVILVIALSLTSAYFYQKTKNDPTVASQAEVKSLVSKVGRLMFLPTEETPTIATVSDPEALKDQAFFTDAKKGDKVLIYSNAKKAILYDPEADKIVTIAPLNTDVKTSPATPAAPLVEAKAETKTPTKKN